MPLYRTGLLIIRAWVEKGSHKPLRAHIRATTDVSKGLKSELTVSDTASASAEVESWLGDVEKAAADDDAATSIQEENKS
jgi:hypothetical protein